MATNASLEDTAAPGELLAGGLAESPAESATLTKLVASLVLFVITLVCGYAPVRLILDQDYIQHAMFAGGGVLMATAFCHLIPEAHDTYRAARGGAGGGRAHEHAAEPDWPAAAARQLPYLEMTLCAGFFFMYLVEQLMVRFINNHTHEHPCDGPAGQLTNFGKPLDESGSAYGASNGDAGAGSTSVGNLSRVAIVAPGEQAAPGDADKRATHLYKFLRGLLIVSAFGAHSIFEGVAIGSPPTPEKVWTIFFAISCHKLIIAAVVGLELFAATLESHLWTLVHLSVFSLMSPLGIVLVVLAEKSFSLSADDPIMVLMQSFATGTLLYIIFVEILQPKGERAHERHKLAKSFSLLAGFGLMLLVLTLMDH